MRFVYADQSRGVPLHALEICKSMLFHSLLDTDKDDSTGLRKAAIVSIELTSLESIMQSYIDQLPAKQAALLRNASILGKVFEPALLYEMAGLDMGLSPEELIPHAKGLLNAGWLRKSDAGDTWQASWICRLAVYYCLQASSSSSNEP